MLGLAKLGIGVSLLLLGVSCQRDVTCPTGHETAKEHFKAAANGKSTEQKRSRNGLIKKKNPKKKLKRN